VRGKDDDDEEEEEKKKTPDDDEEEKKKTPAYIPACLPGGSGMRGRCRGGVAATVDGLGRRGREERRGDASSCGIVTTIVSNDSSDQDMRAR